MADSEESGLWLWFKRIGIVMALIAAGFQLYGLIQDARGTLNALKLESLNHLLPLVDSDYAIRKAEVTFVRDKMDVSLRTLRKDYLEKGMTGKDFYVSDDAKDFRTVAGHYEKVGAIVKLEYLEFDLIFDIVSYPEEFWDGSRELRSEIAENWTRNGGLNDFLGNFRWLCLRYQEERANEGSCAGARRMNCEGSEKASKNALAAVATHCPGQ